MMLRKGYATEFTPFPYSRRLAETAQGLYQTGSVPAFRIVLPMSRRVLVEIHPALKLAPYPTLDKCDRALCLCACSLKRDRKLAVEKICQIPGGTPTILLTLSGV